MPRVRNRVQDYCDPPRKKAWDKSLYEHVVPFSMVDMGLSQHETGHSWAGDAAAAESVLAWHTIENAAESLKVQELELRVAHLERFSGERSLCIPVTSFAPAPFRAIGNVTIVVVPDEDEYTASFFDANIHSTGDTEQEAYENVKSLMVAIYEKLSRLQPEQLGPMPKNQLAVLKSVMARTA